ncbi:hypothetical protein ABPG75_012006 [Micractinium tetrahymenae]
MLAPLFLDCEAMRPRAQALLASSGSLRCPLLRHAASLLGALRQREAEAGSSGGRQLAGTNASHLLEAAAGALLAMDLALAGMAEALPNLAPLSLLPGQQQPAAQPVALALAQCCTASSTAWTVMEALPEAAAVLAAGASPAGQERLEACLTWFDLSLWDLGEKGGMCAAVPAENRPLGGTTAAAFCLLIAHSHSRVFPCRLPL